MTTLKKLLSVTLFASLSMGVHAANFNYNYGQVGIETGDVEGLVLTGSFDITKDIFVLARVIDGDIERRRSNDLDYSEFSAGAGYHMPVNKQMDAVFAISLHSIDIENNDDTGILFSGGIRYMINQQVELAGNIFHTTADVDGGGDTGIYGEARYNIKSKMSAGVNFTSSDTVDGLGINFRIGF